MDWSWRNSRLLPLLVWKFDNSNIAVQSNPNPMPVVVATRRSSFFFLYCWFGGWFFFSSNKIFLLSLQKVFSPSNVILSSLAQKVNGALAGGYITIHLFQGHEPLS